MEGTASRPRLLALHACCGPCLLEPLDVLSEHAEVTVVYFNPNIHPAEEYKRRLDTLLEHARDIGLNVVELTYDPALWHEQVGPYAQDPSRRCRECYRLRLTAVARWAAQNGFDAISTTLTVSPYQDAEAIAEEGRRAASQVGVEFIAEDFRDRYSDATRRSRELGMYRQNYCGCVVSETEAEAQREARRAKRKKSRRRDEG